MGTVQSRSAADASARRATFPWWSNIQIERLRSGRLDVIAGSTTLLATGEKVQPVARLGVIRSILTSSVSPGSAPTTKNGPVMGFGRIATCSSFASKPHASTV
jgi:hypothetical protein